MPAITPEKLHELLDALGDQLAFAGYPVHIVVIGGSGLAGIGAIARATRDVDVVALHRDGRLMSAAPLPDPVIAAARIVARDFRLAPGWLNSAPTSLLDTADGLPTGFANRMITRAFGSALTVSFASRIDQVHLKLYAATDRGEPRDFRRPARADADRGRAESRRVMGAQPQHARRIRRGRPTHPSHARSRG
jgi:hypothetical protein